ncbi:Helix-turn-helix domain protein [compost metagenome]
MRSKKPPHTPQANLKAAHLFTDGLLTIIEAAEFLRVCRATIYNLMGSGELISVCIGRSRRIPKAALIEFSQRNASGGEKPPEGPSY